ncbi:MAG: hypothetical protein RR131_01285 [Anaerovorax sp.]
MNFNETKVYVRQIFGENATKEQVPEKVAGAIARIKGEESLEKELKEAAIELLAGIQKAIRFGSENNKASKVTQRRAAEAFKHMAVACAENEKEVELQALFKNLEKGNFEEGGGKRKW